MTLVSPNSAFLYVAYTVAVVSVLSAFGMVMVDDSGIASITGRMIHQGSTCTLQGTITCGYLDFTGNDFAFVFENRGHTPVRLEHIALGTCDALTLSTVVESNSARAVRVTPCFNRQNVAAQVPVEIYYSDLTTGIMSVASGTSATR